MSTAERDTPRHEPDRPEYRRRVSAIIGETGNVTSRLARQYDAETYVRLTDDYNAPTLRVSVDRWGRYRVTITAWRGEHETHEIAAGDLTEYLP